MIRHLTHARHILSFLLDFEQVSWFIMLFLAYHVKFNRLVFIVGNKKLKSLDLRYVLSACLIAKISQF